VEIQAALISLFGDCWLKRFVWNNNNRIINFRLFIINIFKKLICCKIKKKPSASHRQLL